MDSRFQLIPSIALLTALLSLVSWAYRFVDDYTPYYQLAFYILVPIIVWLLFAGPLFLLRSEKKFLRIIAAVLLVPTGSLWVISVLIGFYGLQIH